MKRRLVLAGASAAILGLGWRRFQRLSEPDVAATDLPLHTSLQRGITKYLQVGDILFRGRDDSWGELGVIVPPVPPNFAKFRPVPPNYSQSRPVTPSFA